MGYQLSKLCDIPAGTVNTKVLFTRINLNVIVKVLILCLCDRQLNGTVGLRLTYSVRQSYRHII